MSIQCFEESLNSFAQRVKSQKAQKSKTPSVSYFQENSEEDDYSANEIGRWTFEEHLVFVLGILNYGNNWRIIREFVKTRSYKQIRSHAQKFLHRLVKQVDKGQKDLNLKMNKATLYAKLRESILKSFRTFNIKRFQESKIEKFIQDSGIEEIITILHNSKEGHNTFTPSSNTLKKVFSVTKLPKTQLNKSQSSRSPKVLDPSINVYHININVSPSIKSLKASTQKKSIQTDSKPLICHYNHDPEQKNLSSLNQPCLSSEERYLDFSNHFMSQSTIPPLLKEDKEDEDILISSHHFGDHKHIGYFQEDDFETKFLFN